MTAHSEDESRRHLDLLNVQISKHEGSKVLARLKTHFDTWRPSQMEEEEQRRWILFICSEQKQPLIFLSYFNSSLKQNTIKLLIWH